MWWVLIIMGTRDSIPGIGIQYTAVYGHVCSIGATEEEEALLHVHVLSGMQSRFGTKPL